MALANGFTKAAREAEINAPVSQPLTARGHQQAVRDRSERYALRATRCGMDPGQPRV
jgi:hypothetical protein